MTPREIKDALSEIAEAIGATAYVSADITARNGGKPLSGCIYPNGVCKPEGNMRISADDWPELFDALWDAWAEHEVDHRRRATNKMALEIIRITDEQGECTDAALRGAWTFTDADVARFGSDACAKADEMAGRGPFKIIAMRGANAA